MSSRILVITRVAAHFRSGLYCELSKLCSLTIFAGRARSHEGIKEMSKVESVEVRHTAYYYLPFGLFISPHSIRSVWSGHFDKVIVTPTPRDLGLFAILLIAYFRGIPVYGFAMGNMPGKSPIRTFVDKLAVRIVLSSLTKVLCYSTLACQYYSSLTSRPCITVYNSNLGIADIDQILDLKVKYCNSVKEEGRLCFIGRLVPGKNIEQLCTVFSELEGDSVLEIIGDGPLLIGLKHKFSCDSRIIFRGFLEREEAWKILVSADAFILPGLGGLAIQEAIACDCFVICAEGDGTELDLITNNVNGVFFEPNNFEDLQDKLINYKTGRLGSSHKKKRLNQQLLKRHNVQALSQRIFLELTE